MKLRAAEFDPSKFVRDRRHRLTLDPGVPVVLVRGKQPGKTLVATAGVHGDEYEGVRALMELTASLDPSAMRGDLLTVPVANPEAFWSVSRTSPVDGGNLARVFPGKEDGSLTEQIAHTLGTAILPNADLYIDLHSGGVRYAMPALIGYYTGFPEAAEAARVFGADVMWGHPVVAEGRSVSRATELGIPWLYTEMRGAGRVDSDDLKMLLRGLNNLLRHLGILEGVKETPPCRHHLLGDGNIDHGILSGKRGFLIPRVELLDAVRQGQMLGTLYDMHGERIEDYHAPCAGIVVLTHACPLVQPGEPLFLLTQVHP